MSHQKIIQDLIAWIDEHIDQPLNIDVVAKKSGYSKWYLQRMFRTVTHQTLGDYIRQRRLLLAAVELRTTERPIFDIAMDLGYVSQQTFSRVFRRQSPLVPWSVVSPPVSPLPVVSPPPVSPPPVVLLPAR